MNKEVFCVLARRYQRKMYEIAYRIVGNEADAWDAVSEGILHAYEKRNKIRNEDKFAPWIYQIIRNEAINILRLRKRESSLYERLVWDTSDTDVQRQELNAVMRELPEDCREEMILFYYCGLSMREIADLRQMPLGTVKSRMYRGRKILKKRFRV